MTEMPADRYEGKKHHLLPYVPHFRIPENKLQEIYAGFEIASHTRDHVNLGKCSEKERIAQIKEDVERLSALFNQDVIGFAYPYGMGARQSKNALEKAGIRYARLATTSPTFRFPEDPLAMPLSCWHISSKTFRRIEDFIQMEPNGEDLFFLMFAHGYEFDFGTKDSSWKKFEKICKTVFGHDDIICCSIGDAFRQHYGE